MNSYNVISENSDTDLTAHRLVKFTATGVAYAGVTDNPVGTTLNDTLLGKEAGVALKKNFGIHFVTVADATAIVAGDELELAANGQVIKASSGRRVGVAREPSTEAGSIIRAYLYSAAAGEATEGGESALTVPQSGVAAIASPNGTDLATTETLANELKGSFNTLRTKLIAAGILS
jgi:hypothetical protein